MKYNVLHSLWIIIFLLSCCTHKPSVLFEEPQPRNEKNQLRFKNRFIGTYLNLEDSSILIITSRMIVREKNMLWSSPKKELDTMRGYKIKNDSLFGPDFPGGMAVKIDRDTVYLSWINKDTIFMISDNNVLRHFRDNYFLNYYYDTNKWEVKKLEFTGKNKLAISEIRKDEIDNLKKVTNVKEFKNEPVSDSSKTGITYIVKPSRKDFKKFIRSGGFTGKNEYIKVRLIKR